MLKLKKLRLLILPAAVAGLAVVSTTGIVRAYQANPPRSEAKVARRQNSATEPPAAIPPALPKADEDVLSDNLVVLQVEAELLEFRINAQKGAIQAGLQALMSFDPHQADVAGMTDENLRARRANMLKRQEDRRMNLLDAEQRYAADRKKLARLKREIARQSKALGEHADASPDVADLARRLDSLEAKVDKLLKGQGDKAE